MLRLRLEGIDVYFCKLTFEFTCRFRGCIKVMSKALVWGKPPRSLKGTDTPKVPGA